VQLHHVLAAYPEFEQAILDSVENVLKELDSQNSKISIVKQPKPSFSSSSVVVAPQTQQHAARTLTDLLERRRSSAKTLLMDPIATLIMTKQKSSKSMFMAQEKECHLLLKTSVTGAFSGSSFWIVCKKRLLLSKALDRRSRWRCHWLLAVMVKETPSIIIYIYIYICLYIDRYNNILI
jgi:hypothetical protein